MLGLLLLLAQPVMGSPIRHVIVVIQENRTFDNLFASSFLAGGAGFPGADTTKTATIDGKSVALRETPFEFPADPSHTHAALVAEWNGGKMDGFAKDAVFPDPGYPTPPPGFALGYLPASETTMYHLLAQRYALADENFAPRLVPTFPGHLFLVAAQSQAAEDPTELLTWGCDSTPLTTVAIFTTGENVREPGDFPCFDDRTIGDLLDDGGVSWKYYTGTYKTLADAWVNVYDAIRHIRYGPDWERNVDTPMSNVLSDIQNCKLPQVSYVTPTWVNSDHAGSMSNGGPAWVGSIYMAIVQSERSEQMNCRYYNDTAMIVTWDDSGGWYDHAAPPAGPDGTHWGFRVPIIVVSPWARTGVSHTQRESTAIVRYIEHNWALGTLGQRDASGDDLSDMFDYARATPVAPFSELGIERVIRQSNWSLAESLRDTHVVDDDR